MKDLKAFLKKLKEDKNLAKKVNNASGADEIVSIGSAAGYTFTADDLMDEQMSSVSGGVFGNTLRVDTGDIRASILDASKVEGKISVNASGVNSVAQNQGNLNISK